MKILETHYGCKIFVQRFVHAQLCRVEQGDDGNGDDDDDYNDEDENIRTILPSVGGGRMNKYVGPEWQHTLQEWDMHFGLSCGKLFTSKCSRFFFLVLCQQTVLEEHPFIFSQRSWDLLVYIE